MMRNSGPSPILMFIHHMAAGCMSVDKTNFLNNFRNFLPREFWKLHEELNLDCLNPYKFLDDFGRTLTIP